PPATVHQRQPTAEAQIPDQFHRFPSTPASERPSRDTGSSRSGVVLRDNPRVEQRIDEVVLADGTTLAYASVGQGRPLVYVMGWLTHLRLGWELPAERALYEGLAQGCRLVRYDRAGCGLSAAADRPPSLAFELEQLAAG